MVITVKNNESFSCKSLDASKQIVVSVLDNTSNDENGFCSYQYFLPGGNVFVLFLLMGKK